MKYTLPIACLLAATNAIKLSKNEPWDKDSLPKCPADTSRTKMDDGRTHVTKYPYNGASCQAQVSGDPAIANLPGAIKVDPLLGEPAAEKKEVKPVPWDI